MEYQKKTDEFYSRLQKQLEADSSWPAEYLYKFIVPSDLEKIAAIAAIFDGTAAVIKTKDSTKGNYTSISVRVTLPSAEAVIEKYLEVSKVDGVISL